MKIGKKLLGIICIVVVIALVAVYLLMPEAVNVAKAESRDVSGSVKVTGNISGGEVETIYAPVSGKISTVHVKAGDKVTTETVIAEYDLTLIENELNKANSAWEAGRKNYEAAVADSNEARGKYEQAASEYGDNTASMEEILGEISALEVSNRAGYLSPEDRREVQSLESQIKDLEGKINIRMTDLNGAQGRIENMSGYSPQYVAARAELSKATRDYNAAKAGIKAGTEGDLTFYSVKKAGDKVKENEIVAVYTAKEKTVNIKSPITGTLKEVMVNSGETYHLRKDQTIMTFEMKEFEDRKASAQAQAEIAKANVSSSTGETINRANTDAYNAAEDIRGYYGQIQNALTRINELNAKAYDGEMDYAEYQKYQELQNNLTLVQQRLSSSLAERQFQEGRKQNEYALMVHKFNADVAEADVITAEYNMDLAKAGIGAEREGVIVERLINDGGSVQAGTPICTIQYTGVYKVNVMVSKYDIDDIEIGQTAKVTLGDMKYEGEVSKIFPVAETDSSGKPKVKVEVMISDPSPIPTIGLEANVEILIGEEKGALSVPNESVYGDNEGDYVYVLEGSSPKKQYVTLGLRGSDYATIKDGISEGSEVITSPFSDDMLSKSFRGKN